MLPRCDLTHMGSFGMLAVLRQSRVSTRVLCSLAMKQFGWGEGSVLPSQD